MRRSATRMTEDKQIKEACKILGGLQAEEQVKFALAAINVESAATEWTDVEEAKSTKGTLKSLRAAIKRAIDLRKALPDTFREIHFRDLDLERHVETCDRLIGARRPQGAANDFQRGTKRKRLAAREARALLRKFARPESESTTRGGSWCRLAAILYGDKDADLYHQVCAIKRLRPKSV